MDPEVGGGLKSVIVEGGGGGFAVVGVGDSSWLLVWEVWWGRDYCFVCMWCVCGESVVVRVWWG